MTGEHVEPLLVYSRAWVDRPLGRRKGVRVVPARMLLGYLDRQPRAPYAGGGRAGARAAGARRCEAAATRSVVARAAAAAGARRSGRRRASL